MAKFAVYLLAFFFLLQSFWIKRTFGSPTLEQILYHFQFGSDGLLTTDQAIVFSFVKWCVLLPIGCAALASVFEWLIKSIHSRGLFPTILLIRKLIATACWHALVALNYLVKFRASLLFLVISVLYWVHNVSGFKYLGSYFGPDYFSAHYVSPHQVSTEARDQKNLVLIYVESLENTYRDKELFGVNLLESLEKVEGLSFNRFAQVPGTGWTIAGIVASQCGIPLKSVSAYDENEQGRKVKSFLQGATCLGDILSNHGYRNVFMGGASLSFAGKGKFLSSHGYHELYGRDEWVDQGVAPEEFNAWGLPDDHLFSKAKAKVEALQSADQPFNLTLLTVDSHAPGYPSRYCLDRGMDGFLDTIKCTADQLADFVDFMRENEYLATTNVVIVGDHLAMSNPASAKLGAAGERHIFNLFVSDNLPEKRSEEIVHFDLFPTILDFLGIHVEGNQLGLGYSALNASNVPPSARVEEMERSLLNYSKTYLDLWRKE